MKYYINTYGCQMNIHDSEKIAGILEKDGYTLAESQNDADVVVFNTCCVRETAELKIYGHIGQMKKLKAKKPSLVVAVVGCMSQQNGVAKHIRESYPYVDVVLGTSNLNLLSDAVKSAKLKKKFVSTEMLCDTDEDFVPVRTSYPNAWVNITYGCNNFCTYCIVPYVRGRERSRRPESVLAEVKSLVDEGYKEITLLGQNVNSYGKDVGSSFAYLLTEIGKMPGKFRLRFMSSHPKDLSDEVIDAIAASPNICNYVHLPVQSGSSEVLRAMNRHYTHENYVELVQKIRKKLPDVGISTDIMVGFPGETDFDFEETLRLVRECNFSSAFCFVYSRRKGTPAAEMPCQISAEVKRERITKLIAEQNASTKRRSREMQGNVYEVLAEDVNAKYENTYCGRTECGRLVNFKSQTNVIGQFVNVKIVKSSSATLWGELVGETND